ncbi:MAG TPA: TolC family protein [Vicinamibacterales bacterium]|nr:TolC family protein [Vicinamibacterales bacterium]
MKRTGLNSPGILAGIVVMLGYAASAHAQISEARIQELIKQAADRAAIGAGQTPQTQAPGDPRPVVPLTLEDAVKFALDRNLDIAVQRLNPEISDIAIASIRSAYRPLVSSTISGAGLSQLPTSQLIGGSNVVQDTQTINGALTQGVPWGGGSLAVSLSNFRQTSTSNNVLYNPTIQSVWQGTYTQPLLRGFRTDSTRRQLVVTKVSRDISDVQLRATITNTVSNVRSAYWDYVFAVQSVDVAQQSVTLAEQLVKDNQTRVEVGTMAPIDVVQAQSQAATARQNLAVALQTRDTAELALKRLIVNGTQDTNWSARLDPVDRPDFHPETIDVESAVRRALSERTDLDIARKNVTQNDATFKYLRDQLLPQSDFQATYGLAGIGGIQYQRNSTQLGATPVIVPGGIGDTFGSLFGSNYPRWTFALNFSYPLGQSSQEASVARARVQMNQINAQVKQIELQVATDVTNAAITAKSNVDRVQAAQAARELAQKQLEAEQSKFEVGMSTNYNVIQSQRDLATAQTNELQAVLNYRKSLVELDRLQQTTLQSLSITVLSPTAAGTITIAPQ